MRFNKLDLNLLVALDAMLAEGSISRAAERLHLSQSAMSGALARLRQYFGDDLLVQVGRRMELTPRAEVLRDAVRDLLMRVDTTIAAQPEFDPQRADREFRISVSDYTLLTLIPHVLELAQRRAPKVRFHLLPQVEYPSRALEHGEADLLVIPQGFGSEEHPQETLLHETFVCAVWSGSLMAQGTLTLERYRAAGHVVMVPATTQFPALEGYFLQQQGIDRRVEARSYSFIATAAMLVGTDRIATLHRRLALVAQRAFPITLHEPPVAIGTMGQTMQWHKYRTQDPGLRWLRQLLHDAVAAMDHRGAGGGRPPPAAEGAAP